jgi:tetratricopeptide (TPR) repeat protein
MPKSTCLAQTRVAMFLLVLLIVCVPRLFAQNEETSAKVKGSVRDSNGRPVANASVHLESKTGSLATHADSQGIYIFPSIPAGSYKLRAELTGSGQTQFGPFTVGPVDLKTIDLTLVLSPPSASMPSFYDEPKFTVAGVTQTGTAGGHGSDNVLRTSEALAKATASLSKPSPGSSLQAASKADLERASAEIRARLAKEDTAELHHSLAGLEERLSNPLEAVREYQRAAEMDASEPYLFDWGSELLSHRALEPAAEIFTKGNSLFPRSGRMLIGLGVTLYARGSYDAAIQRLFEASDLNPSDPIAYLFLGKMQGVEAAELNGFVDKFARFAQLQPDNALANYYYAVSLWKQSKGSERNVNPKEVEDLLDKSIRLDPSLSVAYLQLGIIAAESGDLQKAIRSYQRAVETDPNSTEAHYRLAQTYLRAGDKEKSQGEFQLYNELSKKSADQAERERQEIQQFVITLRDGAPASGDR